MKKGKYMDYTCLIACLSHNNQSKSTISKLIDQVRSEDMVNEKVLVSNKIVNVSHEIVELIY